MNTSSTHIRAIQTWLVPDHPSISWLKKIFTTSALHPMRRFLRQLAEGYAWVLLLPSAPAGIVFLLLTFVSPKLGIAGLLGATLSLLVARWMRADESTASVYVFNGLLTGLFLASNYALSAHLLLLLALASAMTGVICHWLSTALWRFAQLPILSLPFVLAAWFAHFAAVSYPTLLPELHLTSASTGWGEAFLSSFGSIYSQPEPYLGGILFIVLLFTSRTLAYLAALGFAVAMIWQALFSSSLSPDQAPLWGFNSVLAAMATGGLFVVPSRSSLLLAVIAALLAAFLSAALTQLLAQIGLSPLALPFLLSTWLCLYAAQRSGRLTMAGAHVQLPEKTLVDAHLALARLGDASSISLALPFMGEWQVAQGRDGAHTHRDIWRNALDFIVTAEGLSYRGSGQALEDFHCFGLPIVSPCYGQIVRVENGVADNAPGAVNLRENWGNYVLIRLYQGAYVLLAHLRQDSVTVAPGEWVCPGQRLASCGNSGRSPQPHLHLSVVSGKAPESATLPFHLNGILLRKENEDAVFHLWADVAQGDWVAAAGSGKVLPLPLMVGQGRTYRVQVDGGEWRTWRITPELTLDGRFRLVADSGASCLCEVSNTVFACYGREGERDDFFDLWLLAAGCTPTSEQVAQWRDQPPARWLPGYWHGLGALLWPFSSQTEATYRRAWDDTTQTWQQDGRYYLSGRHALNIDAAIIPDSGLAKLRASSAAQHWKMELVGAYQTGDMGVPAREWTIPAYQA